MSQTAGGDTLCQWTVRLTNVDTTRFGGRAKKHQTAGASRLSGSHQAFGETVNELAVGRGQIVEEAVDGFDDDSPLGETGDGAQRIQAGFHFERHANAQLRVVLDPLAFPGSCRRAADAATWRYAILRHAAMRRRGTAEMRGLRCASDTCQQDENAIENITFTPGARKDPLAARAHDIAAYATAQHSQFLSVARACETRFSLVERG